MGGRFARFGRLSARIDGDGLPFHLRVVGGKVRAQKVGVVRLEIDVGIALLVLPKVEVAALAAAGEIAAVHDGVGAFESVRRENSVVRIVAEFEPEDVLFRLFVEKEVRAIEMARGMQDALPVVGLGRHDETFVLPIHEVVRGIEAHAPRPDLVLARGVILVFPEPIVGAVLLEDLPAVRLDALAVGIQPRGAGGECGVHDELLMMKVVAARQSMAR